MPSLRDTERASIRLFLLKNTGLIKGDTLDYGCGLSPYRDIIEDAGGRYQGYDSTRHSGSVGANVGDWTSGRQAAKGPWHTIVCTQVIQYTNPAVLLRILHRGLLEENGWLLITGPTNWPIVETDDLERLTPTGAKRLMQSVGFTDVNVGVRAVVEFEGERWPLGWGAVGRAV